MKKLAILFLSVCVLFAGIGYAKHVKHMHQLEAAKVSQSSNQLLNKKNPVFTLKLSSNPTTGYSWILVSYNHDLLTLDDHQYIKPKAGLMGAGGQEVWHFEVKEEAFEAPHLMTINLVYARSWELVKGTKSIGDYKMKVVTLVTH